MSTGVTVLIIAIVVIAIVVIIALVSRSKIARGLRALGRVDRLHLDSGLGLPLSRHRPIVRWPAREQ